MKNILSGIFGSDKNKKDENNEKLNSESDGEEDDENVITGYDNKKKSFSKDCYSKYVEQEDEYIDELI